MKLAYTKPELSELGHLSDLTAATGTPAVVDVPLGTPANPADFGSVP
jgi:hypothetical protein